MTAQKEVYVSVSSQVIISVLYKTSAPMKSTQTMTFSYIKVRTRENAESIAFFQGGPSEAAECKRRLRSLYWALLCKNVWYNLLQLFTNYYRYATILVPPLTLCPAYFAGEIQFGTISQATYAFDRIEVRVQATLLLSVL